MGVIGESVCVLMAESYPKGSDPSNPDTVRTVQGTAVFITATHIITAGHNLDLRRNARHNFNKRRDVNFLISFPGMKDFDFGRAISGKMHTVKCKVLGCNYVKGNVVWDPVNDTAILETGFVCPSWVQLTRDLPTSEAVVDVLGYPGTIGNDFVMKHPEFELKVKEGKEVAGALLPEWKLVVSRGKIQSVGDTVSYKLSTCPGMSGGCVVYKGKVIGAVKPRP